MLGLSLGVPFRNRILEGLPPSGYLSWLNGGTTDGLTLIDKVTVDPLDAFEVVDRSVASFDAGVSEIISIPYKFSDTVGNIDFSMWFNGVPVANRYIFSTELAATSAGRTGWCLRYDPSGFARLYYQENGVNYVSGTEGIGTVTVPSNEWVKFRFQFDRATDGFTITIVDIDGITIDTIAGNLTTSPSLPDANDLMILGGAPSASFPQSGLVCEIKETSAQGFHLPLEEGAGTTHYDVSGNGNHGTASGGVTWTTASGIESAQALDGFSLYEHATSNPIYVPYGSDGSPLTITPPTGYTKTSDNPSGYVHNGGSYKWIATDFGVLPGIYADYGLGETFVPRAFPDLNGKISLILGSPYDRCYWDGVNWIFKHTGETWTHATATGTFPPTSGWPTSVPSGLSLSLTYDVPWIDTEEFVSLTYADLLALAQLPPDGTDHWSFSYDDNANIVDGILYSPVLSGSSASGLAEFLAGRHS